MDLDSFLFGNIDEQGRLEDEELDEELKRYLAQFSAQREHKELVRQILDGDQGAGDADDSRRAAAAAIRPSASAIDYSDITEEIEETERPPAAIDRAVSRGVRDFSNEDLEEFDELFRAPQKTEGASTADGELVPQLRSLVQEDDAGKSLKFTSLFLTSCPSSADTGCAAAAIGSALKRGKFRRRDENPNADVDTRELQLMHPRDAELRVKPTPKISFKGPPVLPPAQRPPAGKKAAPGRLSQAQLSWMRWEEAQRQQAAPAEHAYLAHPVAFPALDATFHNVELVPWDRKAQALINGRDERPLAPYLLQRPYLLPHNWDLERGAWADSVITDERELPKAIPTLGLLLNMNDPYLLFDRLSAEDVSRRLAKAERILSRRLKRIRKAQRAGAPQPQPLSASADSVASPSYAAVTSNPAQYFAKPQPDRCNLSNDRFYESVREQQQGGAQGAHEKVTLHHSIPALRLQPPHFRCALSRAELRSFHRPRLAVGAGERMLFGALKENRRARKNQEFGEVIKNSKGLTLRDDTPFVLVEFSEELPPLVSCSGMGSLLHVYYRKRASRDEGAPEHVDVGIPTVLDAGEPGPFMGFVDVAPGQELAVLFNNMYRAPLFRHEPRATDFLLVRYAKETHCTHYLRPVPHLFVAGQTLPCMEVFSPHSRRFNTFCRNRMQVAAYRYFMKRDNPRRRVRMATLTALFPQFSEGAIRKWLKEYAESSRQGRDSGYWLMRANAPALAEDELQQLVTPELVCQYESMLVGQQRLLDTGHAAGALGAPEPDALGSATHAADASAFSEDEPEQQQDDELRLAPWHLTSNFLLATQGKAMLELHGIGDPTGIGEGFSFLRVPLKAQIASRQAFESPRKQVVSRPSFYHRATLADQQAAYRREINQIWERSLASLASTRVPEPGVAGEPALHPSSEDSLFQAAADARLVPRQFRGQRLVVTRTVRRPNGDVQTETDVVCDARVIEAYLQQLEARKAQTPSIGEQVAQRGAEPISKPTSNKKRPVQPSPSLGQTAQPERTVKCGACGQLGHMRTNRLCPLFAEEAERGASLPDSVAPADSSRPITLKLPKPKLIDAPEHSTPATQQKPISLRLTVPAAAAARTEGSPYAKLNRVFERIVAVLVDIPDSWPFHRPVEEHYAPHYHEIVRHPMDLSTIRRKCARCAYHSEEAFVQDLRLMHANCVTYNGPEHPFSGTAAALVRKVVQLLHERAAAVDKALQAAEPTEGHANAGLADEQRTGADPKEGVIDILM